MSPLHWQAAAPGIREVYDSLSLALPDSGYYLAGGTALALLEGHRVSVDLDVFCPELPDPERLLAGLTENLGELSVLSLAERTLYVEIQGIQVSFIEYRYPLVSLASEQGSGRLALAHRDDIAAMKLSAIANRGSRKDFVDLWILLTRHRTLPEYLELFGKKFAHRDVGYVVRSLVYFDDADREPPLRLLVELEWERIKQDFRERVSGLLR